MVELKYDEVRFEEAWRAATYLIYNCALSLQLASQRIHGTDPSEYLIFSVVACGNLQRRMREMVPALGEAIEDIATNEDNVPMSRRRIAEATGLPRETVRRTVRRLMDRGLLIESADGYILVPAGLVRSPDFPWEPDVIMAPVMAMLQGLTKVGILQLRAEADDGTAHGAAVRAGPEPLEGASARASQ